jgi:hypothetical protein
MVAEGTEPGCSRSGEHEVLRAVRLPEPVRPVSSMEMRNTLLVQFPSTTRSSFDRVIEIEESLIQGFAQNRTATVDGHDFGAAANIFIFPKGSWSRAIEIVLAYLKLKKALDEVLVIKRLKNGTYQVVWPKGFTGDFERV